jgi:hypothetical protein
MWVAVGDQATGGISKRPLAPAISPPHRPNCMDSCQIADTMEFGILVKETAPTEVAA